VTQAGTSECLPGFDSASRPSDDLHDSNGQLRESLICLAEICRCCEYVQAERGKRGAEAVGQIRLAHATRIA